MGGNILGGNFLDGNFPGGWGGGDFPGGSLMCGNFTGGNFPGGRRQGMSSRRLEDVFSVTIFRLPRRLARGLENVFKTSWKTQNCFAEDVLKTS